MKRDAQGNPSGPIVYETKEITAVGGIGRIPIGSLATSNRDPDDAKAVTIDDMWDGADCLIVINPKPKP